MSTNDVALYRINVSGDTYSVAFSILRGVKKRILLAIHQSSHTDVLDKLITKKAKEGSLKLWKSKRGIWYVLLSVSMDVPDAEAVKNWIGVDRVNMILSNKSKII